MITTLLHLLRLIPFLCGGHRQLVLENEEEEEEEEEEEREGADTTHELFS